MLPSGRFTSGEYDELDGFSGYDASETSADWSLQKKLAPINDEKTHELERVYRVGIPNDLLEL